MKLELILECVRERSTFTSVVKKKMQFKTGRRWCVEDEKPLKNNPGYLPECNYCFHYIHPDDLSVHFMHCSCRSAQFNP